MVLLLSIGSYFSTSQDALGLEELEDFSNSGQSLSSYLVRNRIIEEEADKHRIREGTKITNRLGRFRQAGDRAIFITKTNVELGGLPNLNLERIVRTLKGVDDPESIWWSVSGIVTEFSGKNYLLIDRAVYKSSVHSTSTDKTTFQP